MSLTAFNNARRAREARQPAAPQAMPAAPQEVSAPVAQPAPDSPKIDIGGPWQTARAEASRISGVRLPNRKADARALLIAAGFTVTD